MLMEKKEAVSIIDAAFLFCFIMKGEIIKYFLFVTNWALDKIFTPKTLPSWQLKYSMCNKSVAQVK